MAALRLALAQLNPTVGDVDGNAALILKERAALVEDADLLVTGELALSGYPPEDLVLRGSFIEHIENTLWDMAAATAETPGPALLVGAPWKEGEALYNAAVLMADGGIKGVFRKRRLPNYGVFDEERFFESGGADQHPLEFAGYKLGVMVCEDMWFPEVSADLAKAGAQAFIVLNGSPFEVDKTGQRAGHAKARVAETGLPLAYVNLVGGQDELVFDGGSFALNKDGAAVVLGHRFHAQTLLLEWEGGAFSNQTPKDQAEATDVEGANPLTEIYQAMVLGLRDYVNKNGFPGVLIGLSGGIDSALSAAVAVDALGPERVRCVMMPSPYTSQESLDDAAQCADMLGVAYDVVSIKPAMDAFGEMLAPLMQGTEADTTEENVQARSRGLTLMALSNKFGAMVLSTGNKSEMSVGYATLYGDMCGGYSVLKDVYKMTVFALSRWRNGTKPVGALGPDGTVMPERIITKPPSAELKPDQTDQDSLPPYEQLDAILYGLIEEELSFTELAGKGHPKDLVERVWRMLNRAEYKRRQAPPGVKISSRAFGRDRRYPITDAFMS